MKVGAQLLLACVVLAVIKAAVTGLLVVAAVGGITCLLQRPRETMTTVAMLAATVAFVAHPGITVGAVCVIVVLSHVVEKKERRSPAGALCRQLGPPK